MIRLKDTEYGHFVGSVTADTMTSRYGRRFFIEGYAVVDKTGEVVGTYDERKFYNYHGKLMAVVDEASK